MERLLARLTIGMTAGALAVAFLLPVVAGRSSASAGPASLKGRIVFASNFDGDFELYLMRADGSGLRKLTNNTVDDTDPAWAPGGRRIVFERARTKGQHFGNLFILSLRTGEEVVWNRSVYSDEGEPDWSPNGKWIAFRGHDGGDGSDVLARRVTGDGEPRYISSADHNSVNHSPSWSPDGKRVAVVEEYDESDIFVASFRRYGKRRVTPADGAWKTALDWSPAGNCILYSHRRNGTPGIYMVSAEGGSPRTIFSGSGSVEAGSWSPDGRHIVFTTDANGSDDIYVMRRNGSRQALIKGTRSDEIDPDWYGRSDAPSPAHCSDPDPEPSESPSPSPSPSLTLPLP